MANQGHHPAASANADSPVPARGDRELAALISREVAADVRGELDRHRAWMLEQIRAEFLGRRTPAQPGEAPRSLDTNQAAEFLGEKTRWVRDHKDALGVVKDESGRLWFPPDRLEEVLSQRRGTDAPASEQLFTPAWRRLQRPPPSPGGTA